MSISNHKRSALSILAAGAVVGGVAITAGGGSSLIDPDPASASGLEQFNSCEGVLEYAKEHRWAEDAYPYEGGEILLEEDTAVSAAGAESGDAARTSSVPETGAVGPEATGTNVQEAGIDEPDIAKLSGTTLFSIKGRTLSAWDVSGSGEDADLLGELTFEGQLTEPDLLIYGEKLLVIGTDWNTEQPLGSTRLLEVDVSDPAAMDATREMSVEGSSLSARLQGSTARLVLSSEVAYPDAGSDEEDIAVSLPEDAQTGATGETGPEQEPEAGNEPGWLPQVTATDLETGESETGALFGCSDISYPDRFSGLDMTSVLTMDLSDGLEPTDVESVVSDGSQIYASDGSLYVSTPSIERPESSALDAITGIVAPGTVAPPMFISSDTMIHRFDTSEDGQTTYSASGEVEGSLIGQFAMSEEEGVLRVASTKGDSFAEGVDESESLVTVLGEDDGRLKQVGRVGGLGRGEEIFAVRFIGDVGYVVTFEQTDPLYTIDLSDPSNPETTGELKIPGYSAYLHPVADGTLLGIGQAGTEDGSLTGAQASLFDVADLSDPTRTDTLDLDQGRYGSASTEWDHHAFLYSPEQSLAVVPVMSYAGRVSKPEAVAVRVDPEGGLEEVGRLEHDRGAIERILVVGDNLVTLSRGGVELTPMTELAGS